MTLRPIARKIPFAKKDANSNKEKDKNTQVLLGLATNTIFREIGLSSTIKILCFWLVMVFLSL